MVSIKEQEPKAHQFGGLLACFLSEIAIEWKENSVVISVDQSRETILIVDDEKEIADLLEVYLKNEQFQVKTCYHPKEVIPYLEQEPVSLAILDVMMPELDGFRLLCLW